MRTINAAGRILVKAFEGILDGDPTTVNVDPYLDPVGIWTIGWGHAIRDVGGKFLRGPSKAARARELYPVGITIPQAEDLLTADLLDACRDVLVLVTVPLSDNQFSALASFEFNCGRLGISTLLKKINTGDYPGASGEFRRWNKGLVNGELKVISGLVRRREAERLLFLA